MKRVDSMILITIARRALPLMCAQRRAEAERIIAGFERTANAEEDPLSELKAEIAAEWEADLQPVRTALAAALHAGSLDALAGLRHLLPGLLREVNASPRFVRSLAAAMTSAAHGGMTDLHATANAVQIAAATAETDGLRQLRQRSVFETDLGSAELRSFSQVLRNRSIYSARTTNADYLEEVKAVEDDVLSGKINQATGRFRLLGKLKELGYDPAIGFPGDMANVPPAEKDSLQDLSSRRRLDLVIETNVRMAANYGRMLAGNQPYELREYPAWELKRIYAREVERGTRVAGGMIVPDEPHGWPARWRDAASSVGFEGVAHDGMIARKDSPIWQALGNGVGGYTDTLLNPFPPFAFRSGMGWRAVPRAEARALALVAEDESPAPMEATLSPSESSIVQAYDRLSPELQAELKRELEALGL